MLPCSIALGVVFLLSGGGVLSRVDMKASKVQVDPSTCVMVETRSRRRGGMGEE